MSFQWKVFWPGGRAWKEALYFTLLLGAFSSGGSQIACATEAPNPLSSPVKAQDILVFDTTRIAEAKVLLDAKKQLDILNDLFTKKFLKEEERFKKAYDELMSSQKTLSVDVFQEKQQVLKKRFEHFQSQTDFKHRQIQLAYRKIMDRVQTQLHEIIDRMSKTKKAKYVFVKGICVWFEKDSDADITDEVMKLLDREVPPQPIVLPSEEEVRSSGLFSSLLPKENGVS